MIRRTEHCSVLLCPRTRAPNRCLSAIVERGLQAGRTAAGCESGGRKVRAPQDRVTDNIGRPQGPGKCNRKQTAARHLEPPSACRAVRVKRCGKSAPAAGQLAGSANPTRSKAKQRGAPAESSDSVSARRGPCRHHSRVGCSTRRATGALEKWPSPAPLRQRGDRTRLTGPLEDFF